MNPTMQNKTIQELNILEKEIKTSIYKIIYNNYFKIDVIVNLGYIRSTGSPWSMITSAS
jgi:hypothetical protein